MVTALSQINWLADIVAEMAASIVGFVWYRPPLFGRRWAGLVKAYGRPFADDPNLDPMKPVTPLAPMGVWLVGFLIDAFVLALAIELLAISSVGGGIAVGVAAWAGFAATLSSWPAAFATWPWATVGEALNDYTQRG
jgi:hypothetical protein